MSSAPRQLITLRRMALLCMLLILVVTTLSAYMRLVNLGLGCADWPSCYGASLRASTNAVTTPEAGIAIARMLHRLSAMIVLVLALTMAATAFLARPRLVREGWLAIGLIVAAVGLAVLGRYTAGAKQPIIAIGNVLGGFTMLAVSFAAWFGAAPSTRRSGLAVTLMLLLIVQIAAGVFVSAGYSGLSCTGFPACGVAIDFSSTLLDPTRVPQFDATLPIHPQGAFAHMLHRGLALLVTLAALATSMSVWRSGARRAAIALGSLLVLQIMIGLTLVHASLPFVAALAHNVVAALMLLAASACLRVREHSERVDVA